MTQLANHVVLVGCGRVGQRILDGLVHDGAIVLVLDEHTSLVEKLGAQGIPAIAGSALKTLATANLAQAKSLLIAIPDVFEAGQIVQQARAANPDLVVVARAHSEAEAQHLINLGASAVVEGAAEIARALVLALNDRNTSQD